MFKSYKLAAIAILVPLMIGSSAWAQACLGKVEKSELSVSDALKCLASSARKARPVVPSDAIIALDRKCPEKEGWSPYEKANGRFLIGVGQGPLKEPVYLEKTGGAETHQLKRNEMPTHSHQLKRSHPKKSGDNFISPEGEHERDLMGHIRTLEAGGSDPHNNMPPYIALYFCQFTGQKDG